MKKIMYSLVFILSAFTSYSQFKEPYSEIVSTDTLLKRNDLFINSKKFFVDVYKSGKDVIQMEDKEAGIIIGKGYFSVIWKASFLFSYDIQIWHTIKISVKDGKYKYEIYDFNYKYYLPGGDHSVGGWQEGILTNFKGHNHEKVLTEVDSKVKEEISLLKKTLQKQSLNSDF